MVAAGLGIALVPHTALLGIRPDVHVLWLGSSAPVRRILAATRRHGVTAPGDSAMLAVLREVAVDLW
jgi:DNA-binding transcriptional LysR family regulator